MEQLLQQTMKPDTAIKRDVELELGWVPDIDTTDITVSAKNRADSMNTIDPARAEVLSHQNPSNDMELPGVNS
jgi:hypothetical protein